MILDAGKCTVFRKVNTAAAGRLPVFSFIKLYQSWYGKLNFVTTSQYNSESRESSNVSLRIEVLRNDLITNHDCVVLSLCDTIPQNAVVYEVTRAYHGIDNRGQPISDLDLEVVQL